MSYKTDKVDFTYLPFRTLGLVARVMMMGAGKYAPNSWKKVPFSDPKKHVESAFRHLENYLEGSPLDEESGLPHLAHATCRLMMALYHDDRLRNEKESKLIPISEL